MGVWVGGWTDDPYRHTKPTPPLPTQHPPKTTQLLFAIGSASQSFPLMLLGRCVYGLGGENMSVAQSSLVAEWFRVRYFGRFFLGGGNLVCVYR